ncbi:DUF2142 domain-containing protein [Lactococcus fujiensis]|uniref:DUF2142 domain-containing protein n=1 Tax=Lactococcus fujiensis TaxID=610251 RepID=UPI0020921D9D|nr:DUF2142 domain-containing protein [Lactococcus fujiensis]
MIFLFAVFPTNLWIIAGFQYDWLYYGLSMLIIGLLTRFFSDEKVSRKKSKFISACDNFNDISKVSLRFNGNSSTLYFERQICQSKR